MAQGLFDLTPDDVIAQQNAMEDKSAANFADMNPYQRANYMLYKAGSGLGNLGAGMLGMVNPQVEQAKKLQAAQQGIDMSTPEGLKELARRLNSIGMGQHALSVIKEAKNLELSDAKKQLELAQAYKALQEPTALQMMQLKQSELGPMRSAITPIQTNAVMKGSKESVLAEIENSSLSPQDKQAAKEAYLRDNPDQFQPSSVLPGKTNGGVFSSLFNSPYVGEAAKQAQNILDKSPYSDPEKVNAEVQRLLQLHIGAQNHADAIEAAKNRQTITIQAANDRQQANIIADPKKAAFDLYRKEHPDATAAELAAFNQSLSSPRSPVNQAINAARAEKLSSTGEDLTSDEIMGVIAKNSSTTAGMKNWFGNGQGAKNIESLNKIGQHLDYVNVIVNASGNSIDGMPMANWVKNKLGYELGGTPTTSLDVAKSVLTQEVQKFVGGVGTASKEERQNVQHLIDSAQNKDQMRTAIEAYKHMIGGQIDAVNQHYITDTKSQNGLLGSGRLLPQAEELLKTYGSKQLYDKQTGLKQKLRSKYNLE